MIEVVVYEVVIVLTKTSILLQYVTVFVVHRKRFFHIFIHIIIWGNAIFALIVTFLFIYRVSLTILTREKTPNSQND